MFIVFDTMIAFFQWLTHWKTWLSLFANYHYWLSEKKLYWFEYVGPRKLVLTVCECHCHNQILWAHNIRLASFIKLTLPVHSPIIGLQTKKKSGCSASNNGTHTCCSSMRLFVTHDSFEHNFSWTIAWCDIRSFNNSSRKGIHGKCMNIFNCYK